MRCAGRYGGWSPAGSGLVTFAITWAFAGAAEAAAAQALSVPRTPENFPT